MRTPWGIFPHICAISDAVLLSVEELRARSVPRGVSLQCLRLHCHCPGDQQGAPQHEKNISCEGLGDAVEQLHGELLHDGQRRRNGNAARLNCSNMPPGPFSRTNHSLPSYPLRTARNRCPTRKDRAPRPLSSVHSNVFMKAQSLATLATVSGCLVLSESVRHLEGMNKETALFIDHVDAYIESAKRELAKARQQEDGSRQEAGHLEGARLALENAVTVLGRTLPSR
jgi:hypothetical protein